MEDLKFEIAKKEQLDEILEFLLDSFRKDEPISRAVGMTREDGYQIIKDLVEEGLAGPVSFVCTNEENQIVGVRLNAVIDMKDKKFKSEPAPEKQYTDVARTIDSFLDVICEDLPQLLPDCNKLLKFIIVSVHPNYQRRGIARKLVELSMDKGKELGCEYVSTAATAINSQKMFEKLQFKTLRIIEHKDFCQNGRQLICCDDGTTCGKLMVKKL